MTFLEIVGMRGAVSLSRQGCVVVAYIRRMFGCAKRLQLMTTWVLIVLP